MIVGARYGLILAALGTVTLTPDALLMRLSGMEGFQMTAWRGLLMGAMLILAWCLTSPNRGGDLRQLRRGPGLAIIACQFFNSTLFCLGIAMAPVAIVLLGVAAVPVFSALLSWALLREATSPATWITIAAVISGIGFAVTGEGLEFDATALLGALFGLGVAFMLAANFVVLRAHRDVPLLLAIGVGAILAGVNGVAVTGVENLLTGWPLPMITTGAVVLPLSFFMLSLAARHTLAAHVSLLMLLETVLGPLWVWLVIDEAPTSRMLLGGVIVVGSLAAYLWGLARAPRPGAAA